MALIDIGMAHVYVDQYEKAIDYFVRTQPTT